MATTENYYTGSYKSSADTAGYNSKASVLALQKELNAAGAGIAEDGIWGSQTDAAYQQYGSSLSSTATATPTGTALYEQRLNDLAAQLQNDTSSVPAYSNPYNDQIAALTQPKTDAEYKQAATDQYTPQYNAEVESAQQGYQAEQLSYSRELQQLKNTMNESRAATNQTQQQNINDLQNSMLRRGIARSSYAGQMEGNARGQWADALAKIEQDYLSKTEYIGQQQTLSTQQLSETLMRLQSDLEANIRAYEQTLRTNDRSAQISAYQSMAASFDSYQRQKEQLDQTKKLNNIANLLELNQTLYSGSMEQEQFNAQYGDTSLTSPTTPTTETNAADPKQAKAYADYLAALGVTKGGATKDDITRAAAAAAVERAGRAIVP